MIKKMFLRRTFPVLIIAVLAAALVAAWLYSNGWFHGDGPVFPRGGLVIERADDRKFPFHIEIATTHEQQAYGLMYRRHMAADAGMLFLFDPPAPVSFWMKNTVLPLDMLFARTDGTIEKIVTHAVPFSLEPIPSDVPVRGVVEINGGEADRLGLKTGDKVLYPAFTGM